MRIISNFLLVTLLLSAVSSINATYFNIQIFSSQNGGCLGLISDEYHDYNDCFPFTVGATTYYAQLDSGACNAGGLGAGTLMVYAAGDTSCGGSFLNDGNAPFTDGSYTVGSCANTFKAGDMGDYLITCDFATTPTTTTTTTTTTGPTTTTTTGSNIFAMTVFNDNGASGPYTCASTVLDTVSVYADQCFLLPQQAVPVGVIGAGTYYGKFPSTCDNSGAANNIQVYTDATCTNAQSGVSFSAREGVCDTYFDSKTYIGSCIAGGTTAPAATTTTTAVQPYLIVEYFTGTTCGTADTPATATVMKDTCFAIGDALSTYLGQSGLYGWVYFSGSVYSPPDSSYLFPTNQGDDWKVELYTDSGCNSQYSTTNAVVMGATSGACVIPDGGAATASVKATWVDPSVSTTTTTTIDTTTTTTTTAGPTTTTTTTTGVSSTSVSFALFSDTACSVVGSPAQGFGTVGSTCFNNPNAGVSDVIVTSCTAGTNGVVIDQYSTEDGTCVTFAQTATLTEGECTNLGSGSLIAYCALTTGALPTTTTTTAGPTTTTTTTTAGPTTTTTTTTAGPTTTTTTTTAGPTTTTTTTTAGPTTTTTTTTAGPTTTTTTTTAGPTTTTTTTTAGPTTTTTTGPTTTAAPTTTLSPNGDSVASNSSSSLTTGEKVGIGVGSAAGFTLISVLVYLGWAAKAAKAAKVAADAADAAEMVSPKPETKQFDQHQHQHQVTVQISHSASPV